MNINATLIGQIVFLFALLVPFMAYYLGRRKTETPVMCAVIGFFTAFIPPIAIIYLVVLVLKSDIQVAQD